MNFLFFSVLIITLLSFILYKKRNISFIMMLCLLIVLIVKYPQISINSAKDGINLWIFVILPSMLPFFIINDLLISLRVPENISKLFTPFARVIFNTSGYGAYAFIMSIFSGYPTGAKIVADLIKDKKISTIEGQKILTFSSTSGPLFIIGVVGATMLGNANAGYLLILAHISGAIINGAVFSILLGRGTKYVVKIERAKKYDKSISEMLANAILNSFVTCGLIGGYIILFSVIIALLNKIEFFKIFSSILTTIFYIPIHISDLISNFLQASLEISNGAKILTSMPIHMDQKLLLLSFIIAFSGISIIGQVSSIISRTDLSLGIYIFSKISHGILSAVFCYIFIHVNLFNLQTTTSVFNRSHFISNIPLLLELLLLLLLFLNLLYRGIIIYKYARFYKNK